MFENPADRVAGRRLTQQLMDFDPSEAGTETRRGGAIGGLHTGARVKQNQGFGDGVENRPLQAFGALEGGHPIAPQGFRMGQVRGQIAIPAVQRLINRVVPQIAVIGGGAPRQPGDNQLAGGEMMVHADRAR